MGREAPRAHPPFDRARRLVAKAGLAELTGDDRAAIYGALLSAADRLRDEEREQTLILWSRRGHRAFAAEMAEKEEGRDGGESGTSW